MHIVADWILHNLSDSQTVVFLLSHFEQTNKNDRKYKERTHSFRQLSHSLHFDPMYKHLFNISQNTLLYCYRINIESISCVTSSCCKAKVLTQWIHCTVKPNQNIFAVGTHRIITIHFSFDNNADQLNEQFLVYVLY